MNELKKMFTCVKGHFFGYKRLQEEPEQTIPDRLPIEELLKKMEDFTNAPYQRPPIHETLKSLEAFLKSASTTRPCGLMDKASDFGSEDCRFESCHGRT